MENTVFIILKWTKRSASYVGFCDSNYPSIQEWVITLFCMVTSPLPSYVACAGRCTHTCNVLLPWRIKPGGTRKGSSVVFLNNGDYGSSLFMPRTTGWEEGQLNSLISFKEAGYCTALPVQGFTPFFLQWENIKYWLSQKTVCGMYV